MTRIRRIIRDYAHSGALNAHVGITAALDDHTFLSKSGALVMFLRVQGIDGECLDAAQLEQVTRRFEGAIRTFDEHFRLYQYLLKRGRAPIPTSTYANPIVRQAVESRTDYLTAQPAGQFSLATYMAVAYEGGERSAKSSGTLSRVLQEPMEILRQLLSDERRTSVIEAGLSRARDLLRQKVLSFQVQLPEALQAEILDKNEAFRFLRRLLNYAPHKADGVRLKFDDFVDFQACDSALECHRDHLRLDDDYVSVLALKEPPGRTFAHLLRDLLALPCNFVLASEWRRESNHKMLPRIRSKRRHFHNSKSSLMNYVSGAPASPQGMLVDDAAVAQIGDLGACLEELEVQGRSFGAFSMTLALFDEDWAHVKRAAADGFKIFAAHDARLIEERYNLLNAWLALLPGNSAYNLRPLWLLDSNYADLSFLFAPHAGEARNAHLGAEYLAVLETHHRVPYCLNLHVGDIGHTLILGATGSGKSFLLNFLLTHAQKYDPLTFIFDLGGGYENLTRLFGGAHLAVGLETRAVAINPFSLPPTPENLHFLFGFLKVLIESGSGPLADRDERDLYEQIENLYSVDADQRRLYTLANMLGRTLRGSLQKWVRGGPYAAVFDNAEDTLTFARFQAFDFEGMEKIPQVLEPLLFYILHRANAAIQEAGTAALKLFVMDEAWRFLHHPTISQYVLEALKTWRKKNGAMILATQSSEDLARSEMLRAAVESCATKIFLANPDVDQSAYRELFHLNETEAAMIPRLVPKQEFLIKRPDRSKVLTLRVGPRDYWLYTSNPFDRERRREAFERHGFEQGLDILAQSGTTRSPSS